MLDQQCSEITLDAELPWYMTPDGFIVQDGGAKAIGLSQPKSLDELEKVGNNMFRPTRQDRAGAAATSGTCGKASSNSPARIRSAR